MSDRAIQIESSLSLLAMKGSEHVPTATRLSLSQGHVSLRTHLCVPLDTNLVCKSAERQRLMASDAPQPLMQLLYRMTPVEFASQRKVLGLVSRGGRPKREITQEREDLLKDLFTQLADRFLHLPVSTMFIMVLDESGDSARTLWRVLMPLLTRLVDGGRVKFPGDDDV